jgi:hypothetical protein
LEIATARLKEFLKENLGSSKVFYKGDLEGEKEAD